MNVRADRVVLHRGARDAPGESRDAVSRAVPPRRRRSHHDHGSTVPAAIWLPPILALLLSACASRVPGPAAGAHIDAEDRARAAASTEREAATAPGIPAPVSSAPSVPPPAPVSEAERYTVVVNNVPVRELLFALARDADLQIDVIGEIEGRVTLNAIDQTLPRLLERISMQAPIRYRLEDDYLSIAADDAYAETYDVPYVNMSRETVSTVDTSTQIEATGFGADGQTRGGTGGNNSTTALRNETDNRFWQTLERNLADLLNVEVGRNGDRGEGSRFVIVNREAGYITVRATQRQHREVQRYLDRVIESARRQVLIEATVVEVQLSDRFQAGVDWARLADSVSGFDFVQNVTGTNLGGAFEVPDPPGSGEPALTIGFRDPDHSLGDIQGTLKALETFGDVRVMSSPKITSLNNQLSILKVVDNRVFFTVEVQSTTSDGVTERVFETQVNTVPVGLVMSVTPYIGDDREVLLNVRPTVSRVLNFVNDPNPDLAAAGVANEIPEIQVREMESLLRVSSGQVAVLGGLMQDTVDRTTRGTPGLSRLPLVGSLFRYRDDETIKSELIIFLRPTVVTRASLDGDFQPFQRYLDPWVDDGVSGSRGVATP